jgi:hypothetical protein
VTEGLLHADLPPVVETWARMVRASPRGMRTSGTGGDNATQCRLDQQLQTLCPPILESQGSHAARAYVVHGLVGGRQGRLGWRNSFIQMHGGI